MRRVHGCASTPKLGPRWPPGNEWPRHTLASLGFAVRDHDTPYAPDAIPGVSHVPVETDGCIHADTYVYPATSFLAAIDEMLGHSGRVRGTDGIDGK